MTRRKQVKRRREIPVGVVLDASTSKNEDDWVDPDVEAIISEEAEMLQRRGDRMRTLFSRNKKKVELIREGI